MLSKIHSALRAHSRALLATGLISLALPALVHAGPPLICHPYAIGDAKSLPGGGDWLGASKTYDRQNLVRDTLAILKPETPIIVRMETLRRATIYATSHMRGWGNDKYTAEDRQISADLLAKLQERTADKDPARRAVALFDAGFFAETLRQTGMDPKIDGYALLVKAADLRRGDPEVEFALALATVHPKRKEHAEHLARARAAAREGTMLASNLASHFSKS